MEQELVVPRVVVRDGTGRPWTVERHWAPRVVPDGLSARWRRRRERREEGGSWDLLEVGELGDDPISGLVGLFLLGFVALAGLVLLFSGVLPVLLGVVDLALFFVLLPLYLATRVLLRRPWVVEARSGEDRRDFPVVGWRRAGRVRDEVAEALRRGVPLHAVDPSS